MSARVAIVGWGAAGAAAAHAAHRLGASVTVVGRAAGATALTSGALDDVDWFEREAAAGSRGAAQVASPLDEGVQAFCEALGIWTLAPAGAPLPRLATVNGVLRSARGHDAALLDLARAAGRTLLVPRAPRASWDADLLARSLARETDGAVALEVVEAPILRFADEARISDADLASRHDDDGRLAWLADRLLPFVRRAGADRVAVLLGPWLGTSAPRAERLEARLGCPVGEALASGACVAGLRFAAARDAWLATSGVPVRPAQVTRVEQRGAEVHVSVGSDSIAADAVVLAVGGVVGGGVLFEPPEHGAPPDGPEHIAAPFRLSCEIPGARVAGARVLGPASSAFGPVLDGVAWPSAGARGLLERVGVVCDEQGRCAPRVFAAGEVVLDRPRTLLEAVRSGALAGARAAEAVSQPVSSHAEPRADGRESRSPSP